MAFETTDQEKGIQAEIEDLKNSIHHEAKRLAMNCLNRKECAARDIENYLAKKKVPQTVIQQVIAELIEARFLNDERFGGIMAVYQTTRGKGPLWIKNKLKEKGIHLDRTQIVELVQERTGNSELALALKIVERRYPLAKQDQRIRTKAIQALMRRGFSYDVAKAAIQQSQSKPD